MKVRYLSSGLRIGHVVASLISMSMTVFLNIRLIIVTRRSSAFAGQQRAPGGNDGDRIANSRLRVTVTTIVIVILFLVCQLPVTIVQILAAVMEVSFEPYSCNYFLYSYYLDIGMNIGLCLVVVNSLADCVMYCLMGKRFRKILARELSCRRINGRQREDKLKRAGSIKLSHDFSKSCDMYRRRVTFTRITLRYEQ